MKPEHVGIRRELGWARPRAGAWIETSLTGRHGAPLLRSPPRGGVD